MDTIHTKLSAYSASSSVYAETGAPDIRHLNTLSGSTDKDEDPRSPSRLYDDAQSVCSTVGEEDKCPHLLSSLGHDSSSPPAENSRPKWLQPLQNDDATRDTNTPSSTSLPIQVIQRIDNNGSVEVFGVASSITLSDSFRVLPKQFHFSQSLMPEATPRSRYRTRCTERQRNNNLSVIAPTPGRYQRPIDSLLVSNNQQDPSPISKNVKFKHRRPMISCTTIPSPLNLNTAYHKQSSNNSSIGMSGNRPTAVTTVPSPLNLNLHKIAYQNQSSNSSAMSCLTSENFNPQSPGRRLLKGNTGDIVVAAEPKWTITTTPKNALAARCDFSCRY